MELLQALVTSVRRVRALTMIGERKPLDVLVNAPRDEERSVLERHAESAQALGYMESLSIRPDATRPAGSAVSVAAGFETFVTLGQEVDMEGLKEVLQNRLAKTEKGIGQVKGKLSNKNFVDRADPDVVTGERERLVELEHDLKLLQRNLDGF
jgi:valyl-tRNA synthetase